MLSIMFSHQRFVHVFPFNVFESFGHWGVDVFLFLSGMGMVDSLMAHTVKEFYFRRFKRLIPLCVSYVAPLNMVFFCYPVVFLKILK